MTYNHICLNWYSLIHSTFIRYKKHHRISKLLTGRKSRNHAIGWLKKYIYHTTDKHWNRNVVILKKFSSLASLEVVEVQAMMKISSKWQFCFSEGSSSSRSCVIAVFLVKHPWVIWHIDLTLYWSYRLLKPMCCTVISCIRPMKRRTIGSQDQWVVG